MFEAVINNTPELNGSFRKGLQALGPNSAKISLSDTRLCQGSVDIDTHLVPRYPNANRWDYVFGYNDVAYFVEVHSAKTSEVQTVINKYTWLIAWLKQSAPQLNKMNRRINWIATNSVHILSGSKQFRRLAVSGLSMPRERLLVG